MARYSLTHLSDHVLLHDLAALVQQDRATTAALLAHLAEVDARRLYLPAAYPSMFAYCVGELRLSEDAAFKRIRAARTGRQFPALFTALADGRLHLSAVVLLAPHLAHESADDLIASAAHRTKAELEQLLAERFPRPDVPTLLTPLAASISGTPTAPEPAQVVVNTVSEYALGHVGMTSTEHSAPETIPPSERARLAPLSPGRFALQATLSQHAHDQLRYAQALLGHAVPDGDLSQVLERALDALVGSLEKTRYAACARSRPGRSRRASGRYVPAHVRREVWRRDEGRCTFVSDSGRRCEATSRLEFDHSQPVARGGDSRVSQVRLRCRAHNQYEAERTFGTEFMRHKREAAQERARERREMRAENAPAQEGARGRRDMRAQSDDKDVRPWLRTLGFRADEARRGAELCEAIPDASLEDRIKYALKHLSRIGTKASLPALAAGGPSAR